MIWGETPDAVAPQAPSNFVDFNWAGILLPFRGHKFRYRCIGI